MTATPDTTFVTGPNFAQAKPSGVYVTPTGGSQTTLQAQLSTPTFSTVAATTVTGATVASTGNMTTGGYNIRSVATDLTAAGTTRADALQLAKDINNITTAAASTGAVLPLGVVGMTISVFNGGANAIKMYALGSETIDGTAGATGVTLSNTKRCEYYMVKANTWISAQLGAVSA